MGEMCQSLVGWFQTINVTALHSSVEELSDGVALAQSLHQFAPDSFTEIWLSKIKTDVGSNWRLKMSNLKKVIEGIYDYYSDVLSYNLAEFPRPDAMRIAEKCNISDMERLLQLVLGCAVNCASKQDYIRQIMMLEESLQANIMRALQELETSWQGTSRHSISLAHFDYKSILEERDELAQKLFDYNKRIELLLEEKLNLKAEVQKLQEDVTRLETMPSSIGTDGISIGPVLTGSARYTEMRRQMDMLKEELLQSETNREDLKSKCQIQEAENTLLQQRIEELMKANAEFAHIKDEVDFLRESNEQLKVYEKQIDSYKKKLQDYNSLKKQVKLMEERTAEYIQQSVILEEDAKKSVALKSQIELFKTELQELHRKLEEEINKNAKIEFENRNMEKAICSLQLVKDNLLKERDTLREVIDELKCGNISRHTENLNESTMSKELQPTILVDKLHGLEVENLALREGQGSQIALVQLLDNANKRNEDLREQLKTTNERIMTLTLASLSSESDMRGNDLPQRIKEMVDINERKELQLDECSNQNAILQNKISQLENTLTARENELLALDAKYRKCVERAKEVIKNMDPRVVNGIIENCGYIDDDIKSKSLKEEENLMTTAFKRLCINTQREVVDSRLSNLLGQGQTFLSRQRESASRQSMSSIIKLK